MINIFTLAENGELIEAEGIEAAREAWGAKPSRLWISIEDPSEEALNLLEDDFAFHPAAMRDVREQTRIPKLSPHSGYNFLLLHRIFYQFEDEACDFRDVAVFFSAHWIVTVSHGKLSRTLQAIKQRVRQDPADMMGEGVGMVLLNILEGVVNDYHPAVSEWQETLGSIEAMVLEQRDQSVIDRILKFKKLVTVLHKHLVPQKLVMTQLYERCRPGQGDDHLAPFFKNAIDEMSALLRELDGVSSMATSVFDTYAALLSLDLNRSTHKLNTVMQRLNLLSAIFLPLTFIVGVYGMNIHDMPELQWRGFYYLLWIFMLGLVGTMLFMFRKMKWY